MTIPAPSVTPTNSLRVSPAEIAAARAEPEAAGAPLSDLLCRAMARTRSWTPAAADAVQVVANLVALERTLAGLAGSRRETDDAREFLACGRGSARGAADYLVGERDAAGQVRGDVEVLRGDPVMVAAVADSLTAASRADLRASDAPDRDVARALEVMREPRRRRRSRASTM